MTSSAYAALWIAIILTFSLAYALEILCRNRFWLIVPINEHQIINSNAGENVFFIKPKMRANWRKTAKGRHREWKLAIKKVECVNLLIMTKSGWIFFLLLFIRSQMNVQFLPLIFVPSRISGGRFSIRHNAIGNIFDMATMPTNSWWWL